MQYHSQKASRSTLIRRFLTGTFLFLVPALLAAHPADTGAISGFVSGMSHPFSGLDHLLAMVAVGLWASLLDRKAFWVLPATFISAMAIGSALGLSGFALPFVEEGILVSVLLFGALIAAAARMPMAFSIGLVALFALFHGNAHGAEMSANVSAVEYTVGFCLATAILHATGVAAGLLSLSLKAKRLVRIGGLAIVAAGLLLWVG